MFDIDIVFKFISDSKSCHTFEIRENYISANGDDENSHIVYNYERRIIDNFKYYLNDLELYGFYRSGRTISYHPIKDAITLNVYNPTGMAKIFYDKYLVHIIDENHKQLEIRKNNKEKYEGIIRNKCNEGSRLEVNYGFYSQFPSWYDWRSAFGLLGFYVSNDQRTWYETFTGAYPWYYVTK